MSNKVINLGLYQTKSKKFKIGEDEFEVQDLTTVQMIRLMHVSEMYKKVMDMARETNKFDAKMTEMADSLDKAMRELFIDLTGIGKEKAAKVGLKQIFQLMSAINETEESESNFLDEGEKKVE